MKKELLLFATLLFCYQSILAQPKSINVMTFGDENTLFIADSKSATIFAYEIEEEKNPSSKDYYNIFNLSGLIADLDHIKESDILIREMKVHPISKIVYVAYDRKTINGYDPKIVTVNQAGELAFFDLENTKHTSISATDAPNLDRTYFETLDHRSLTFTDIDFFKGKLYVSGISNAEFSSTLRVFNYPFQKETASSTTLEIYHASHDQNENRAPIVSMDFFEIEGKDYIIAAYLCTPLVVFPLNEIKDGKYLKGKTIAELGYGNLPNELFWVDEASGLGTVFPKGILITNHQRSARYVSLEDIIKGAKTTQIEKVPISLTAGVPFTELPIVGHLQTDNQDDQLIVSITRDLNTNNLQLLSYPKPMFFRLDDVHFSEFEMPTYDNPQMEQMRKKMAIDPLGRTYLSGKDNK